MGTAVRALGSRSWHAVLAGRGVLALGGRDARKLLQGLVTSDVTRINETGPQHTAFLGGNGRVLHDAFLVPTADGGVLVEAEAAAIPDISAHLKRYKLRSKVTFTDRTDELAVLAVCGEDAGSAVASSQQADGAVTWADPRLELLGYRQLQLRSSLADVAAALPPEAPAELYALMTTALGVPDGVRDMPVGEALPHESNLENLGSIAFDKGCYLGQELTARTQFRGAVRKRLLPVVRADQVRAASDAACVPALAWLPPAERGLIAQLLPPDAAELPAGGAAETPGVSLSSGKGKDLAKLRSFAPGWGLGLALCRLSALEAGEPLLDTRDGAQELVLHRPSWWPDSVEAKAKGA